MSHLPVLPILLPFFAGIAITLAGRGRPPVARALGELATVGGLVVAILLLNASLAGETLVYALGDWPVPYGIALTVDRLSALMVLLTAVLAVAAVVYARARPLRSTVTFQALFQFQLMGLNGAFLTGDLFNLFVFFEVLLIASYGLLAIEGGAERMRAGVHYVLVNLAGSSLFLIGLGIIYGTAGTLNLADLLFKLPQLPEDRLPLMAAAGLLLLVVFGLKAALAPLYLWLPATYSAAPAPVAALFAIMTKVGVYALIRVHAVLFTPGYEPLGGLVRPWLLAASLATLALATVGVVSSPTLRRMVAYLIVLSVGTMMATVALGSAQAMAAALYYLMHSTLVTAGLFLLADLIASQRGPIGDQLRTSERVDQPALLGSLFLVLAVSVAGLPPFSGFFGKLMILEATGPQAALGLVWVLLLLSSLVAAVALSRSGSLLFWKATESTRPPATSETLAVAPVLVLASASALLVVFGTPAQQFAQDTAAQLLDHSGYMQDVLDISAESAP